MTSLFGTNCLGGVLVDITSLVSDRVWTMVARFQALLSFWQPNEPWLFQSAII